MLVVAVSGACRADLQIDVAADDTGGGRVRATVTLDAEAAGQLPDLASELRVADLRRAGWEVEGPEPQEGGGAVLRATKRFGTPAESEQAAAELTGSAGFFRGFRVDQQRSFLRTRTTFRGVVDLSAGIEGFSDDGLRQLFGGPGLGLTPEQLEQRIGGPADRLLGIEVVARLPGPARSNAPETAGGAAVWRPKLGDQLALEAVADRLNVVNVAAAAVSVVAAASLLGVLAVRRRRRR